MTKRIPADYVLRGFFRSHINEGIAGIIGVSVKADIYNGDRNLFVRLKIFHHLRDFFFTQHLTLLILYRIDPRADV